MQVSEIRFMQKIKGVTMFDKRTKISPRQVATSPAHKILDSLAMYAECLTNGFSRKLYVLK